MASRHSSKLRGDRAAEYHRTVNPALLRLRKLPERVCVIHRATMTRPAHQGQPRLLAYQRGSVIRMCPAGSADFAGLAVPRLPGHRCGHRQRDENSQHRQHAHGLGKPWVRHEPPRRSQQGTVDQQVRNPGEQKEPHQRQAPWTAVEPDCFPRAVRHQPVRHNGQFGRMAGRCRVAAGSRRTHRQGLSRVGRDWRRRERGGRPRPAPSPLMSCPVAGDECGGAPGWSLLAAGSTVRESRLQIDILFDYQYSIRKVFIPLNLPSSGAWTGDRAG